MHSCVVTELQAKLQEQKRGHKRGNKRDPETSLDSEDTNRKSKKPKVDEEKESVDREEPTVDRQPRGDKRKGHHLPPREESDLDGKKEFTFGEGEQADFCDKNGQALFLTQAGISTSKGTKKQSPLSKAAQKVKASFKKSGRIDEDPDDLTAIFSDGFAATMSFYYKFKVDRLDEHKQKQEYGSGFVPTVLCLAVETIMKRGTNTEGIFRKAKNDGVFKKLNADLYALKDKEEGDKPNAIRAIFEKCAREDIHSVASLIKDGLKTLEIFKSSLSKSYYHLNFSKIDQRSREVFFFISQMCGRLLDDRIARKTKMEEPKAFAAIFQPCFFTYTSKKNYAELTPHILLEVKALGNVIMDFKDTE